MVDGLLYAVGGHDGPLVRNSVEMYNPETNTWTQLGDMHSCRRNAGKKDILMIIISCSIKLAYCFVLDNYHFLANDKLLYLMCIIYRVCIIMMNVSGHGLQGD